MSLSPEEGKYFFVKASILDRLGSLSEALRAYERAQLDAPMSDEISFRMGWCYEQLGAYEKAIKYYEYAFSMKPEFEYAYRAGQTYFTQGKLQSALQCYDKIPARVRNTTEKFLYGLCETHLECWHRRNNQSMYEELLKDMEELSYFENAQPLIAMLKTKIAKFSCEWGHYFESLTAVQESLPSHLDLLSPWHGLNFSLSSAELLKLSQHFVKKFFSKIPSVTSLLPKEKKGGPLRIGYLSADFRDHPTAHLIKGVFAHHSVAVEVYAYSLCQENRSCVYQESIRFHVHSFKTFYAMPYEHIIQEILKDDLHILVDLMGFTSHGRFEIMVAKPAPIQVNYLGFAGTTGSECIDYMISDLQTTPHELHPYFSERLALLPYTYLPTDDTQPISTEPLTRSMYGLPEDQFVFCSFNAPYKLEPRIFDTWMRILKEVPNSVLWLLLDTEVQYENLCARAQAEGVDRARLIRATREEKARHLARHRLADLFLDTHYLNAHTTAIDALWAGVPVLTFPGNTFASRACSSALKAVGLPELIASSWIEYENRGIHWGIL